MKFRFHLFLSLVFIFILGSLVTQAQEDYTLPEQIENLKSQATYLTKIQGPKCSADYRQLYSGKDLNISIFYGYTNVEKLAIDQNLAQAFAKVLQLPCRKNVSACGFKFVSRQESEVVLQKQLMVQDKKPLKAFVHIYFSAVSKKDWDNQNPQGNWSLQESRSEQLSRQFLTDLKDSDVVFYSGHSRYGSGPDFRPLFWFSMPFRMLFKPMTEDLDKAINPETSRLKLLGIYSCQSDNYYGAGIRSENPRLSTLLTKDDVDVDESEESMFGLLDSLLAEKCPQQLKASMIPAASLGDQGELTESSLLFDFNNQLK